MSRSCGRVRLRPHHRQPCSSGLGRKRACGAQAPGGNACCAQPRPSAPRSPFRSCARKLKALGRTYRHSLLEKDLRPLPPMLHGRIPGDARRGCPVLKTLHFADDRPYAFEERYINLEAAPAARDMTFEDVSANEWLVHNAPTATAIFPSSPSMPTRPCRANWMLPRAQPSSPWNASPGRQPADHPRPPDLRPGLPDADGDLNGEGRFPTSPARLFKYRPGVTPFIAIAPLRVVTGSAIN